MSNSNSDVSPQEREARSLQNYTNSLKSGKKVWQAVQSILPDSPMSEQEKAKAKATEEVFKTKYIRLEGDEETIVYKTRNGSSSFKQRYDAIGGLIEAVENKQKKQPPPDPLRWSDLSFEAFKNEYQLTLGFADDKPGINEIKQVRIQNTRTSDTIAWCYAKSKRIPEHEGDDDILEWTPAHGDYFLALLGTENAYGAGWMLVDHCKEMKYTKIHKIVTRFENFGLDDGSGLPSVVTPTMTVIYE